MASYNGRSTTALILGCVVGTLSILEASVAEVLHLVHARRPFSAKTAPDAREAAIREATKG